MEYRQTGCSAAIFGKVFIQGCNQNDQKVSDNVQVFVNTTSPTPVPKPGDRNSGGGCDCLTEFNSTARGINWSSTYNGQEEWWLTQSLNQDMMTVQTFVTGSTVSLGKCLNMGFKDVAGVRMWHGTFSWLSNDGCALSHSVAPDQTKYLTVTYDVHFSNLSDFDGTSDAGDLTGARTVDANTGLITSTVTSTETIKSGQITPGTPVITYFTDGGAGYNLVFNPDTGMYDTVPFASGGGTKIDSGFDLHCGFPSFAIGVGLGSLADYVASWNAGFPSDPVPDITDINSYSGHASHTAFGVTSTFDAEFSRDDTSVSWDFSTSFPTDNPGAPSQHYSFNGSVTLSNTNLGSAIVSDCYTLLSYWDLTNNTVYPWRTDSYTMYMPKVARREVQGEINPIGFNAYTIDDLTDPVLDVSGSIIGYGQISWQDPNSYFWIDVSGSVASAMGDTHYDGTIIGKPFLINSGSTTFSGFPISVGNGSNQGWGFFNFYYSDARFCKTPVDDPDCGTSPPWELYTYRHGGTLADCDVSNSGTADGGQFINILPQCSTHWIGNIEAHFIPKGASIACSMGSTGIYVVKYAECRPRYPSYNFFRPCGDDRWAIDEVSASCFQDDLVLRDQLSSTDFILLAFTNGFDGLYISSSQTLRMDGDYDLTLGTRIRDLPGNFYHPFEEQFRDSDILGNFGLAGVIRFPQAWPMCGRDSVIISASMDGTGSLITFASAQTNMYTNDIVTLYDNAMSPIIASASLFKIDNNNFTCSINHTGSIKNSRYAQSYGSPDYHWNDTEQKLTYRYGEWAWNNRNTDSSSAVHESCVSGSPCAESVVCFSPNGESFPNGVTMWFSGSTALDDPFGSIRQFNVEFGMIDPLYQTPKFPCNFNEFESPKYVQDTGGCPDDTSDELGNPIIYYPPPPLIEAMLTTPDGAPELPNGITWPYMVMPPIPGVIGFSFLAPTQPWAIRAGELFTCDNNPSCRFIRWYNC